MKPGNIAACVLGGVLVIVILMFAIPTWNVWQQNMTGKAALAKAAQERQIIIEQAKAENEAADHLVSAMEKIGAMAQKYPEYRKQLFMQAYAEALADGSVEKLVFVATEAGIPITEAGRTIGDDK